MDLLFEAYFTCKRAKSPVSHISVIHGVLNSCKNVDSLKTCFENVNTGLFPAILGKGPWPKLEKNDRLNIKIGRN